MSTPTIAWDIIDAGPGVPVKDKYMCDNEQCESEDCTCDPCECTIDDPCDCCDH